MATFKKKKNCITKGEKFLYVSIGLMMLFVMFLKIYSAASLGNLKMSIEKLNYQISTQEKKNESLNMKISELTAFDNVKDVVDEMGLSYNYENIIIIDK
ncbi:MAG: hypothetical protein IJB71_03575 [Bacilli bacterium]|nr:hypothetical protein [Bacilli bacterium]